MIVVRLDSSHCVNIILISLTAVVYDNYCNLEDNDTSTVDLSKARAFRIQVGHSISRPIVVFIVVVVVYG